MDWMRKGGLCMIGYTRALCCITSGFVATFGASRSNVTFRAGSSPSHEFMWRVFFKSKIIRVCESRWWVHVRPPFHKVMITFGFSRGKAKRKKKKKNCTHSPYTPWQRMPSTMSASSPKTQIIRSILFTLISAYPALNGKKSFPGRCG